MYIKAWRLASTWLVPCQKMSDKASVDLEEVVEEEKIEERQEREEREEREG